MLGHLNHIRLLRYAGLFTWAVAGLWLFSVVIDPSYSESMTDAENSALKLRLIRWLALYLAFGALYWWVSRSVGQRRSRPVDYALLLVLTLCAIGIGYLSRSGIGSILLMVVAVLLPWLSSMRFALLCLIAGNVAMYPVFVFLIYMPPLVALLQSLAYVGFAAFVFITSLVARQQAEARDEQRRLNAELRATRTLLAESARVNERTRISRELHDLLGHHLTALSLNLEVATHLTEGKAQEHVRQAHTLARLLLTDVREAVSQLREGGAIDVGAALRPLAENVPALDIQMQIDEPLTMDDPERAHVLLRCTQEIITNTVRHANAGKLWIGVRREQGLISIDARDDGDGVETILPGNGLRGMRERLQQYQGTLQVESRPGQGFHLRVSLPANTDQTIAVQGAPA
ncbi:signal transduction histidine kinase [Luteimonas cucumeris]|uniref:Signal transduction histidine kinase n=1 Tax=Luteimonas cucumeris TaxID=985012 RepID=A0A562L0S2_9GAMM|nr:sensor histidine kinase [Luteimonas cucumeris]TWI01116.1 signal transduction histidine kinase [Luteimonas cucumeris]